MVARLQSASENLKSDFVSGVLAQLVERLNGIEEVRGSNPLGSSLRSQRGGERFFNFGLQILDCGFGMELWRNASFSESRS